MYCLFWFSCLWQIITVVKICTNSLCCIIMNMNCFYTKHSHPKIIVAKESNIFWSTWASNHIIICIYLLEISIFSLNHIIVRPTKIMNNLFKDCKFRTFKVIFQHQKSTESFFLWRILDQLLKMKLFENFDF